MCIHTKYMFASGTPLCLSAVSQFQFRIINLTEWAFSISINELTCAHPAHIQKRKKNFKNTSVEAGSSPIACSHSCRHKRYVSFVKNWPLQSFTDLFKKEGLLVGDELCWNARDPLLICLERWIYPGQIWETKLYNIMNFYPFLVIAESQKGWYFLVELSLVNTIWKVPHLNLQNVTRIKSTLV